MATSFLLPRFYPILDTAVLAVRDCPAPLAAEALLGAGVRILQYRHKDDWTQQHFNEAKLIADLCREAKVLFVVNDRADYAYLLDAGLHVGQHDLPPLAARQVVPSAVLGFSTHNRLQLRNASVEPVEYVSLGPIFTTASKLKPDPIVGLEGLRAMRSLTIKALVAIGGISLQNAREVFEAGADSAAVISGILPAECTLAAIEARARQWLEL